MNRTKEDINKVLELAKLNTNDLLPTCQTIYFSKNCSDSNRYKFLQLNPDVLNRLKEGDTLYINGEPNESTVICTENKTYEAVVAETSNSLLLVDNLKFSQDLKEVEENEIVKIEVEGVFYEVLELNQRKPQLQKVQELLEKGVYKGMEHEFEVNRNDLLSFEELWRKVQASKEELQETLKDMQVVIIDGKLRILDFEYHFRVLSYMLKLIEENSWELDRIDYEETMTSLDELVPKEVLNAVFDLYTEESEMIDGTQFYRYKEHDVCKFFAQVLLYSAGKFNLNEFFQAWQESVPEGMQTNEVMLHGVAVVDRKSNPSVIWAFPESKLPENIHERFKALFQAKEKWSVPEISPYIQRLTTDKLDVNAVLAKHARASNVNGVKYYSSKHGK